MKKWPKTFREQEKSLRLLHRIIDKPVETPGWAACGLIVSHSCITSWADECSLVYNLINYKNNYEATFMLTRVLKFIVCNTHHHQQGEWWSWKLFRRR